MPTEDPLGRAVDELLSHQELLKFPEGSAPHKSAEQAVASLTPDLIQLMKAHEVMEIRTKKAVASLSDDGELRVTRVEMPL